MKGNRSYFPEPMANPSLKVKHPIKCISIGRDLPNDYGVSDFENLTSISFIPHLLFENKKTYEEVKDLCKKAVDTGKISIRAELLGIAYRHEIRDGFVNEVYIKWINNRIGFGLFANKNFEKGEFIGEYVGLVRRCTYLFANVNPYCFRYPLYRIGFWIYTIDAQDFCNETSFINHSDSPNCDAVVTINNDLLHVCVITNKAIEKGSQLTYEYGNSKTLSTQNF